MNIDMRKDIAEKRIGNYGVIKNKKNEYQQILKSLKEAEHIIKTQNNGNCLKSIIDSIDLINKLIRN